MMAHTVRETFLLGCGVCKRFITNIVARDLMVLPTAYNCAKTTELMKVEKPEWGDMKKRF
jgi:hypothetical protein